MFTKKHYIAIAKALRNVYDDIPISHGTWKNPQLDTFNSIVDALTDLFEEDSKRFDLVKFNKVIYS